MTLEEKVAASNWNVRDWYRIFKNITDPDIKAENRRKAEREKRIEQKKKDYGL